MISPLVQIVPAATLPMGVQVPPPQSEKVVAESHWM